MLQEGREREDGMGEKEGDGIGKEREPGRKEGEGDDEWERRETCRNNVKVYAISKSHLPFTGTGTAATSTGMLSFLQFGPHSTLAMK